MINVDELTMLISDGACTPQCLFAAGDEHDRCSCRCRGEHHGVGMTLAGSEHGLLDGLYALTYQICDRCGYRRVQKQLQVKGIVNDQFILVHLFEWLTGAFSVAKVVPVSDSLSWDLYYIADDWRYDAISASESGHLHDDRCHEENER